MILRILTVLILSCSVAMAGQGMGPGPGVKGYAASGITYTLQADFEGSDGITWTDAGGGGIYNLSYNIAPAPLVGNYSGHFDANGGGPRACTPVTGSTNNHGFVVMNMTTAPGNSETAISWLDGVGTVITGLRFVDSDATHFQVGMDYASGGNWNGSPTNYSINTTYYVWWDYIQGTGTAVTNIYMSTTSTKPGSPSYTKEDGTLTTNPSYMCIGSNYSTVVNYDKLRYSTGSNIIGSNPQ